MENEKILILIFMASAIISFVFGYMIGFSDGAEKVIENYRKAVKQQADGSKTI